VSHSSDVTTAPLGQEDRRAAGRGRFGIHLRRDTPGTDIAIPRHAISFNAGGALCERNSMCPDASRIW
jgi:hypothetical protein